MGRSSNSAIKGIVAIGVLAFLVLMVSSFGLKKALRPDENERVTGYRSVSPFDGARALDRSKAIAAAGPRAVGAAGHDTAIEIIKRGAAAAGLRVREVVTSVMRDGQTTELRHVVGELRGRKPGSVVLMAHFDAWPGPEGYVGANDGATASAVLLEYAACAERNFFGRELVFAWLDGGAPGGDAVVQAGKALLDTLRSESGFPAPGAAIYLEGIGDCYLRLAADPHAPAPLRMIFESSADTLRLRGHLWANVGAAPAAAPDLRGLGVPALALVDASYGGSLLEHAKHWHTPLDTEALVCAESLKAVGDLLYHALPSIDGRLDAPSGLDAEGVTGAGR